MFILNLLLCASAASLDIPLILNEDRSDVFKAALPKFERHRLFVNIVDSVLYGRVNRQDTITNSTVSFGLVPSARHANDTDYPAYYEMVTKSVVEMLGCTEAINNDTSAPKYVIPVKRGLFPISPDGRFINEARGNFSRFGADYLSDPGEALFVSKFTDIPRDVLDGNQTQEFSPTDRESSRMVRAGCTYKRSSGMMHLGFLVGPDPQILWGWIVERIPIGIFFEEGNQKIYHATKLLFDHSYIDSVSGAVHDVIRFKPEPELWTLPIIKPFATNGRLNKPIVDEISFEDFTTFRQTETGVLVATLEKTMKLDYTIDNEFFAEYISLRGNFYHVSCVRKQGTSMRNVEVQRNDSRWTVTINDGVTVSLVTERGSVTLTHKHFCQPKRESKTGIPELLDLSEHSVGRPVPAHDRNLTSIKLDIVKEFPLPTLSTLKPGDEAAVTTIAP